MDPNAPVRIGISIWSPNVNPCVVRSVKAVKCDPGIELDILLTLLKLVGLNKYTLHVTEERGCGAFSQNERGQITRVSGLLYKFENELSLFILTD